MHVFLSHMAFNSQPRLALRRAAIAALPLVVCGLASAQTPTPIPMPSHIDSKISGYWELRPDSMNIPPPEFAPTAAARQDEMYKKTQFARRWCNAFGVPADMVSYRPIDIQVGEREVAMPSEFTPTPRHIYLDRTAHNNPDIYEPLPTGDSLARWDGEDLLVETVGFSEKGVTQLPGGGYRTKDSVLAERYHVVNGGKNLLVTFTWYDDKVFAKPYTYSYLYFRVSRAPGQQPYSAGEMVCDASQPDRDESIADAPKAVPRADGKN